MAENLRSTRYANGTAIPNVDDRTQNGSGADNTAWANLDNNDTDKAYCWYNNDSITRITSYNVCYTKLLRYICHTWQQRQTNNG